MDQLAIDCVFSVYPIGPTKLGKTPMRIAISTLFAAMVAALPLSTAKAQAYCNPFPLSWPFCIAGAAVNTAATIATAPFYAVAGAPYYYYGSPYYYPSGYYYPGWRHRRHHHRQY
jgi:hypothetical protein